MVLMHDAPLAVDLAQTHGQSKFKRFPLTVRIDVDALSCGRRESNIPPASDLHVVRSRLGHANHAHQVRSPTIAGVMNAATFLPSSVAPGQIISILGAGLGP